MKTPGKLCSKVQIRKTKVKTLTELATDSVLENGIASQKLGTPLLLLLLLLVCFAFSPTLLGTGVGYNLHCGCPRVLQPQVSSMTMFRILLFWNDDTFDQIISGMPLLVIPTKAQLRWGDTELVYAALWFSRFQDFVTKLFAECLKYLLRQAVVWLYWADTRGTTLFSIDRLNVAQRAGENHLHIDISVFTKPPMSNSLMRILWTEFFTCRFYL